MFSHIKKFWWRFAGFLFDKNYAPNYFSGVFQRRYSDKTLKFLFERGCQADVVYPKPFWVKGNVDLLFNEYRLKEDLVNFADRNFYDVLNMALGNIPNNHLNQDALCCRQIEVYAQIYLWLHYRKQVLEWFFEENELEKNSIPDEWVFKTLDWKTKGYLRW